MRLRFAHVIAASAVLTNSGLALGNGRFPQAQRLIEAPGNADELTLVATYGMVVTRDRGKNWHFVCETAFASQTLAGIDVVVERAANGNLLASIHSSLRLSSQNACEWQRVLGEENGQSVPDLMVSKSGSGVALAVMTTETGIGERDSELRESVDNGLTWKRLGNKMTSDQLIMPLTLDEAPSDALRLYISGINKDNQGILLRSTNRGKSWSSIVIPGTSQSESPFIAAIHPTNPDVLFVRTNGAITSELGEDVASDALLVSTNAGDSWTEVLRFQGKLFGFALSPDAKTLLAGYGDIKASQIAIDPGSFGIYKAELANLQNSDSFTKIYDKEINCLSWTKTGLYACTSQLDEGFALGFRKDADFAADTAAPFEPLMKQPEIKGPLDCPRCTRGTLCASDWAATCQALGACPETAGAAGAGGAPTLGPECNQAGQGQGGSGTNPNPGTGGSISSSAGSASAPVGGSSSARGGTGPLTSDPVGSPQQDESESNCSCRLPGSQVNLTAQASWFALLAVRWLRRRARRFER